ELTKILTQWIDLGYWTRLPLSHWDSSFAGYRHLLDWAYRCGPKANGRTNRRRADEPTLVRSYRGGSKERQPNVSPAVPLLHDQDAYNVHHQHRVYRKLEQHSARREVDRAPYFLDKPSPDDRKATGQHSAAWKVLRWHAALWSRLGRALKLHPPLPNRQSQTRTHSWDLQQVKPK